MEYSVNIQYDKQDNIFVACIPELPGCVAHGKTKQEALEEIEIAKDLWLDVAAEENKPIPKPKYYSAIA